jgi:N-acetylglucosaminyldiphosphoundecaprenol N-acetyl-beta-D-mannosaminyltransferase
MTPPPIPRYNVLGVGVSALTLPTAVELIVASGGSRKLGYICVCSVHGIGEAQSDPGFKRILNGSWLTTPDGMPVVWMGPSSVKRVYGPDLMLGVCDAGRSRGLRHFFYGGNVGVAEELKTRLTARFPGLLVVGTYTPPFRALNEAEVQDLKSKVTQANPDVIWVGLSTPKQEHFMTGVGASLDAGLLVGVGAAFDFHSGRVKQAPRWMQRSGLEWLFRLGMEPRRLGPRYFKANSLYILRVAAQKLGIRKYPIS